MSQSGLAWVEVEFFELSGVSLLPAIGEQTNEPDACQELGTACASEKQTRLRGRHQQQKLHCRRQLQESQVASCI
ncbi:hypothetical protein PF003_g23985 [Phytophthora fragariae]|nr:hypothetical protein PF003_g23985 [Phytophthora fragariae]